MVYKNPTPKWPFVALFSIVLVPLLLVPAQIGVIGKRALEMLMVAPTTYSGAYGASESVREVAIQLKITEELKKESRLWQYVPDQDMHVADHWPLSGHSTIHSDLQTTNASLGEDGEHAKIHGEPADWFCINSVSDKDMKLQDYWFVPSSLQTTNLCVPVGECACPKHSLPWAVENLGLNLFKISFSNESSATMESHFLAKEVRK